MGVRSLFTENTLLSVENVANYFVIDAETRNITPPTSFKNFGVESDENSNRVYFECPRVVGDNLDLTTLNIRINYQNAKGEKDQYIVDDITIDGDKIHFSWLLSRKATAYKGAIMFIVCAVNTDSAGNIINEWNTTLATGTVLGGLEVDAPEIPEDVTDVVSQLLDIVNNSIENVQSTASKAVENVQEAEIKAIENISNILDDTLTVSGKAADAKAVGDELQAKANNIIVSASGSSIVVTDSAESTLKGLNIYGKTTQDGTPTPDTPVELVSVESPEVNVYGANLLKHNASTQTVNGITFTVNDDGSITVNGTATENAVFVLSGSQITVPAGTYTLSGCPDGGSWSTYSMACTELGIDYGNGITVTFDESITLSTFYPVIYKGATVENIVFYPMLEVKEVKGEYEPSKSVQSLQLPYSLHGIPVESGGNYTDADGKQYICDEIDLERGVLVQRVQKYVVTGEESWYLSNLQNWKDEGYYRYDVNISSGLGSLLTNVFCTHYPNTVANQKGTWVLNQEVELALRIIWMYSSLAELKEYLLAQYNAGTPVTYYYVLYTPIETPLTEDELTAYKSLLTNKPTTTLLNSQNAYMELKYAADINNYINQRYVPLSSYLALEERVKALEEV